MFTFCDLFYEQNQNKIHVVKIKVLCIPKHMPQYDNSIRPVIRSQTLIDRKHGKAMQHTILYTFAWVH